jgi:hypothetical protein
VRHCGHPFDAGLGSVNELPCALGFISRLRFPVSSRKPVFRSPSL